MPMIYFQSLFPRYLHSCSGWLGLVLCLGTSALISAKAYDDQHHSNEATLAYFIQVSYSGLPFLPRLLHAIYHQNNVFLIHYDRKIKADFIQDSIEALFPHEPSRPSNVFIMDSQLVTYRGISMVLNTIAAMNYLLNLDLHWDFFINLSPFDYPLVHPQSQRKLLHLARIHPNIATTTILPTGSLNFFQFASHHTWLKYRHKRLRKIALDPALVLSNHEILLALQQHDVYLHANDSALYNEKLQNDSRFKLNVTKGMFLPFWEEFAFQFAKAETWMILSREICMFYVQDHYPRTMLLAFSNSISPAEHYFATVAINHPRFRKQIVGHAFRQVFWEYKGKKAGQHPYPIDMQTEDANKGNQSKLAFLKDVLVSSDLFARKVSVPEGPMLDIIDQKMNARAKDPDIESCKAVFRRVAEFFKRTIVQSRMSWTESQYTDTQ